MSADPIVARVYDSLTADERAMAWQLTRPFPLRHERLLVLRGEARDEALASRQVAGENAGRLAFARWRYCRGEIGGT